MKALLNGFRDFLDLRSSDVTDPFFRHLDWQFIQRSVQPRNLSAIQYLDRCGDICGHGEMGLVELIGQLAPLMEWFNPYPPEAFDGELEGKLAACELVGPKGHFASDDTRMGVFLLGPHAIYRDHWHLAEELYIPLVGGSEWSKDGGPFGSRSSGEIITHESNQHHAMRTKDNPLLALWVWRDGDFDTDPDY